jgi:F-type H+-transporting ATPase subunit delta
LLRGARRYADAIFGLAQEQGRLDEWASDLNRLAIASQEPSFVTLMESSKVPLQQRLAIAERVLPGLHPQASNLLALLSTRGRVRLLSAVAEQYQRLVNRVRGIEEAEVVTAAQLEAPEVEYLKGRLEQARGRRLQLRYRHDPSLLGGMVVRFGDQLVDGSLRTRLEQMRRVMAGA